MTILDDMKTALRISSSAYNDEITDLIAEARADLLLSGVIADKVEDDTDALIKRAIRTYCKANFGMDNPDAVKLQQSYDMLKMHLTFSGEYNGESVAE